MPLEFARPWRSTNQTNEGCKQWILVKTGHNNVEIHIFENVSFLIFSCRAKMVHKVWFRGLTFGITETSYLVSSLKLIENNFYEKPKKINKKSAALRGHNIQRILHNVQNPQFIPANLSFNRYQKATLVLIWLKIFFIKTILAGTYQLWDYFKKTFTKNKGHCGPKFIKLTLLLRGLHLFCHFKVILRLVSQRKNNTNG